MHEIDDKIVLDKCSECGEWGLKTKDMEQCLCCSNETWSRFRDRFTNIRACKEPGCNEEILQTFVVEIGVEANVAGIDLPPEDVGKVVNEILMSIIKIHGPQCEICLNDKFSNMMVPSIFIDSSLASPFSILMKKTEREYLEKKTLDFQREWA